MKKQFLLIAFILAIPFVKGQTGKDDFPKTKISGLIFGDFYYNMSRDTAFNPENPGNAMMGNNAAFGKPNENSIQIRRIYFTYEHKASKNVEALFRLESDPATKTGDNKFGVFVKDANISYRYFKGHAIQFGLFSTGSWEVAEGFWGHRYVEKTITDLRKYTSSRDFGIGLNGKIDSIGKFRYRIMYGEGSGVNNPVADYYKRLFICIQYSPILELNAKNEVEKELTFHLFSDFKGQASKVNDYYTADGKNGPWSFNGNARHFTFLAAYKVKNKYSLGLETFMNTESHGYKNTDSKEYLDRSGIGISVFGSLFLKEKHEVFGRYDYLNPNIHSSDHAKGDARNYVILGYAYMPAKNLSISPNVLIETYEKRKDANFGSNGSVTDLTYKPSVTPRLTFYYTFN
jgi:hypothetical protein